MYQNTKILLNNINKINGAILLSIIAIDNAHTVSIIWYKCTIEVYSKNEILNSIIVILRFTLNMKYCTM